MVMDIEYFNLLLQKIYRKGQSSDILSEVLKMDLNNQQEVKGNQNYSRECIKVDWSHSINCIDLDNARLHTRQYLDTSSDRKEIQNSDSNSYFDSSQHSFDSIRFWIIPESTITATDYFCNEDNFKINWGLTLFNFDSMITILTMCYLMQHGTEVYAISRCNWIYLILSIATGRIQVQTIRW